MLAFLVTLQKLTAQRQVCLRFPSVIKDIFAFPLDKVLLAGGSPALIEYVKYLEMLAIFKKNRRRRLRSARISTVCPQLTDMHDWMHFAISW